MIMRKRYALFVGLVFCAAIAIQLVLEWTGHADSIGLWYTVYAAIIYTAIVVVLFAIGFALMRKRSKDGRARRRS
jgi:nitrogen fixation/metabolism regulation signal transduction histidine kinase